MSGQCSLASHVETTCDNFPYSLFVHFLSDPCDDGSMHVCATNQLKVGSYEDFFPVSLVLRVENPMHHNF